MTTPRNIVLGDPSLPKYEEGPPQEFVAATRYKKLLLNGKVCGYVTSISILNEWIEVGVERYEDPESRRVVQLQNDLDTIRRRMTTRHGGVLGDLLFALCKETDNEDGIWELVDAVLESKDRPPHETQVLNKKLRMCRKALARIDRVGRASDRGKPGLVCADLAREALREIESVKVENHVAGMDHEGGRDGEDVPGGVIHGTAG